MANPARQPWTVDEFFAWQARQTEKYELVSGFPVRLMAGATNTHDDIVVNLLTTLRSALRGSGCRPFTGDGSIETKPGQIRRPDVGVDCGRRDPRGLKASSPRLVAEVLSPTTRDFDTYAKLDEYRGVASIDTILMVEPNEPLVIAFRSGSDGPWQRSEFRDLCDDIGW